MIGGILFVIMLMAAIIWNVFYLNKLVEDKIIQDIKDINAEVVRLWRPGLRDMYSVEYKKDNALIKRNVKYNLFAQIKWL